MPDWRELVRQRLSGLALDAAEREEVHAELAAHLEDSYEFFLRRGLPEKEAIQRSLAQVSDWQDLQRNICAARIGKHTMTNRVTQLWLPGFLTLFTSMGLLMLIGIFGPRPPIFHPTDAYNVSLQLRGWSMIAPVTVVYVPWLLALFLIGALGAYLSHRAGASQRVVFLSILFPVLPYSTFFLIGFPLGLVLDGHVTHNIMFPAFFVGLLAWVLFPGAALLVGGFLAQSLISPRLTSGRVAGN